MDNKKLLTYGLVIGLGVVLWIIAAIVNNYAWYIFLFAYALWAIGWKIYDMFLIKNNYNSENKKFIKWWIIIFIITILYSINAVDYYQNVSDFNWSFKEEYKNVINDSQNIISTVFEKIKPFSSSDYSWNIINDINNSIKTKDYKKAVNSEILFIDKLAKEKWDTWEFSWVYENLYVIKIISSSDSNKNYYNAFLKDSTWFDWFLWNWIFTIFNSWSIESKWKELDTWFIWSIIIYLIDIIALWYWMIYSLSILKLTMCQIHKKLFTSFWQTYDFPTTLSNIKALELDNIIEKMNTIPEKKWFFSMAKTYYCNVSFSKCEDCELWKSDTIIEITFSHYWTSKSKPMTWTFTRSFSISVEQYNTINEKFKTMIVN